LKTIKASTQHTPLDWRIIVYYLLAFGSGGVIKPFLNLYLVEVGLTGTQIGIMQGWTALVAIFVTPLIGLLADRTQRHRFVLGLVAFTKGISAPLMPLSNAWLWLTTTVSLRVISAGAHDAILNRLTLTRLKQNHSQKLGSVRFWGSLSFAATSMLCWGPSQSFSWALFRHGWRSADPCALHASACRSAPHIFCSYS
jgi:MFS family permease